MIRKKTNNAKQKELYILLLRGQQASILLYILHYFILLERDCYVLIRQTDRLVREQECTHGYHETSSSILRKSLALSAISTTSPNFEHWKPNRESSKQHFMFLTWHDQQKYGKFQQCKNNTSSKKKICNVKRDSLYYIRFKFQFKNSWIYTKNNGGPKKLTLFGSTRKNSQKNIRQKKDNLC